MRQFLSLPYFGHGLTGRILQTLLVSLLCVSTASAIEVQIGSEAAQIGTTGRVDIALDDATGLASAAIKVNFDPSVLDLVLVTNENCTVGTNFSIASTLIDGSANIVLARKDGLTSGSGSIASLHFRVNPGTPNGMNTEIVVAKCELGGAYGVGLDWGGSTITSTNGKLWGVTSMTQDSNSNGIPDWWEAKHFAGLTNALAGADDDGDGVDNRHEYFAGTDPRNIADVFRLKNLDKLPAGAGVNLKWSSVLAKKYDVERSTNLLDGFHLIETNLTAITSEITYNDTTATNNTPYFYRIKTRE